MARPLRPHTSWVPDDPDVPGMDVGELAPRRQRITPDPRFWRPTVEYPCGPFFGSSEPTTYAEIEAMRERAARRRGEG